MYSAYRRGDIWCDTIPTHLGFLHYQGLFKGYIYKFRILEPGPLLVSETDLVYAREPAR